MTDGHARKQSSDNHSIELCFLIIAAQQVLSESVD